MNRRIECLACVRDPREIEHHSVGAYQSSRRIACTCRSVFYLRRLIH